MRYIHGNKYNYLLLKSKISFARLGNCNKLRLAQVDELIEDPVMVPARPFDKRRINSAAGVDGCIGLPVETCRAGRPGQVESGIHASLLSRKATHIYYCNLIFNRFIISI